MANLVPEKVGRIKLADMFFMGISKNVTEAMLIPVVGNANFLSGTAKLILALGVNQFAKGKLGNIISGGLVIDGIEDYVNRLLSGGLGFNLGGQRQSMLI